MVKFGGVSGEKLRQIVSKLEKLEEGKVEVAECIREAYGEAKAYGYDVKVLRQLIKIRKADRADLEEQEAILDVYMHALGMAREDEPQMDLVNQAEAS